MSEQRTNDAFMLDADTKSWTGAILLNHLVSRLDPLSPHLPLNLHTVHTLVASRPSLLADWAGHPYRSPRSSTISP
ncbi:hypothetical protein [Amycolatopsis sp. H20-H5]|uniref:hypothetical protein n=1 Tax=Amycolatopsis sp. H20-H5 TaxID=3046309 RepID=UPI002DBFFFA7|nr:hypothetical protein [Amycolatopsis sp. H20-H5]MEC3982469.1 hypothetical protein [Amycolatopsis sp. H20-H5]